jgi:hypothetical protein
LFAQRVPVAGRQVVTASRPLVTVKELLEGVYSKPVTYEDPMRVWRADLQVIPGRDEYAGQALFPKTRRFVLPAGWSATETTALDAGLLGKILDAYHAQNDGARFQVASSRYGLHIVPAQVNDAQGRLVPVTPLLDTVVTVPSQKRSPAVHFQAIMQAWVPFPRHMVRRTSR